MTLSQKPTKKQKKAIAFRKRKSGKNALEGSDSLATLEVPDLEIQDDDNYSSHQVESTTLEEKKSRDVEEKSRKRKAKVKDAEDQADDVQVPLRKKRKREENEVEEDAKAVDAQAVQPPTSVKTASAKQRFILFVGNFKYTTSVDSIKAHFAVCDPPPSIRLLSPKSSSGTPTIKSKGCAFLEFSHRNALQQALKLHHSQLDGRIINVELTAGGGGKSEARLQKLQQRNSNLHGQRKSKLERQAADGSLVSTTGRPQRYSTTSGIGETPATKRTWTVQDNMDEEATHRGGVKHAKTRGKRKSPTSKVWGTGVNAIPVG